MAGIGVALIATSEALTGHAGASTNHLPLAVAVDVVHSLGAGAWLGGLTTVLLCGLPALRPLSDKERPRACSRLVRTYHKAAIESVTLVVLSALIAAWLRLGRLDALWTTDYGRMLLRKVFFVVCLFGFGLYHTRTAVNPEWGEDTVISLSAECYAGAARGRGRCRIHRAAHQQHAAQSVIHTVVWQ